jgi:hypothetical protein
MQRYLRRLTHLFGPALAVVVTWTAIDPFNNPIAALVGGVSYCNGTVIATCSGTGCMAEYNTCPTGTAGQCAGDGKKCAGSGCSGMDEGSAQCNLF